MDIKKDVQQQFGKSAEMYVNSPIHKEGNDLQTMFRLAELDGDKELLDIATGGGHTANAFASFVNKVTALDLTEEMIEAAERFIKGNGHKNISFVKGDAEDLPFRDELFDIVTCRIAPHHFPNVKKFVEEVYRVLRVNGQFLLDDNVVPEDDEFDQFYNTIEKLRDFSHFRAWKKTEWIRMLELSAFNIMEWHRFEKTFQFEPWCNRMNLSLPDKEKLTRFILSSSSKIKNKFKIKIEDQQIISFQGEAIILKAIKKN
jgi:ubiquinone/menaquinone biosynthesis C-methylase UbiE